MTLAECASAIGLGLNYAAEALTTGRARTLALLYLCSRQLQAEGIRINVTSTSVQVYAVGYWRELVVDETPRLRRGFVSSDAFEASYCAHGTVFSSFERLAVLMPTKASSDHHGERVFSLNETVVGGAVHRLPLVLGPTLRELTREPREDTPDEIPLVGDWADAWLRLTNILSRSQVRAADGKPLGEGFLGDAIFDGRLLTGYEQACLSALADVRKRLAAPRVSNASYLTIIGSDVVRPDECLYPAGVADALNAELEQPSDGLAVGSHILFTRRPISVPLRLKIVGFHDEGLCLVTNPELVDGIESDFDGDAADTKCIPAALADSAAALIPQRIIPGIASPVCADILPTRPRTVPHNAVKAFSSQLSSKKDVGRETVRWRVLTNAVPALRRMELSSIGNWDVEKAASVLGRQCGSLADELANEPTIPDDGVVDFSSFVGRIIAEAAVSKQGDLDGNALAKLFSTAVHDPYTAAERIVGLGGIFARHALQVLLTCLYSNATGVSLPVGKDKVPNEARWTLPDGYMADASTMRGTLTLVKGGSK